jgi:diguanylate cyclase (GGDEF)-like protein
MGFVDLLGRQSRACIVSAGVVLVLALWTVDYLTGPDISFVVFYLFPVFLVTWFAGAGAGMVISLLSGTAWFTADVLTASAYSHPSVPYLNLVTKVGFFLIVNATISTLRTSLERERELARTDYVTSVANSRFFAETASQEIRRAGRYQHPFTVAYLDIDDFKKVNDTWGHSTGDALLNEVAGTIRENIRSTDTVARMGGDEFALLLPETGYEASDVVVRKVRESMLAAMRRRGWPVTFSIGVVTFLTPPENVDSMIRKADGFMYEVKHAGKNNIMHRQIKDRAA